MHTACDSYSERWGWYQSENWTIVSLLHGNNKWGTTCDFENVVLPLCLVHGRWNLQGHFWTRRRRLAGDILATQGSPLLRMQFQKQPVGETELLRLSRRTSAGRWHSTAYVTMTCSSMEAAILFLCNLWGHTWQPDTSVPLSVLEMRLSGGETPGGHACWCHGPRIKRWHLNCLWFLGFSSVCRIQYDPPGLNCLQYTAQKAFWTVLIQWKMNQHLNLACSLHSIT